MTLNIIVIEIRFETIVNIKFIINKSIGNIISAGLTLSIPNITDLKIIKHLHINEGHIHYLPF